MSANSAYLVKINKRETVAAALPLQDHRLPLSNFDLLLPPVDIGVFFCYTNTIYRPFTDIVSTLKISLAKVLVNYYVFAGEVVNNTSGEPEIHCNNRGVDFIEAYADIRLTDLNLHDLDESFERIKLLPEKNNGVICIQATELQCGGMVLACAFDHRISDAYSANMFLVSWADTARSKPNRIIPSFRRSLVTPRSPGYHDAVVDRMYVPVSSLPPSPKSLTAATIAEKENINRIYHITAEDIETMQAESLGECKKRSKLEAFTAYLWKLLSKGAKQMGEKACSIGVAVDGRSRLGDADSMSNYFGNVVFIPYSTLHVDEVADMSSSEVAETVRNCILTVNTGEHFRGLIDWVEALRPETGVAKVYSGPGDGVGEVAVVVSSGQRFPVEKVEFGWGRPAFGSYHSPWGGSYGTVMPMASARGDGGWVVYVHLMRGLVAALEEEGGDVFRPLTKGYLMPPSRM